MTQARRAASRAAPLGLALLLAGCGVLHRGFLGAAGPVAGAERHLFILVTIVMLFVIGPVLLITPVMAWHYRLANARSAYRPKWGFSWWLEALIWLPPSAIVVGLAFVLWNNTLALDPYVPVRAPGPTLRVQAVALDWKWFFIYPDQHIAALNALIVPAGRPVSVSLTSGTVMQSLLIPRLAGQIYAMAGMTTKLNFAAQSPGAYLGENTQYNGDGFQAENFTVTAIPSREFADWVARTQKTAEPFTAATLAGLFQKSKPAAPSFYTATPPGLFRQILARSAPGMHGAAATPPPQPSPETPP